MKGIQAVDRGWELKDGRAWLPGCGRRIHNLSPCLKEINVAGLACKP